MFDPRILAAIQIGLAFVVPTLLPFVGVNVVITLLAVGNAFGGIAHLYGYRNSKNGNNIK